MVAHQGPPSCTEHLLLINDSLCSRVSCSRVSELSTQVHIALDVKAQAPWMLMHE